MEQMQTQELISALADGQLQGEAFARGVELAATDPAGRDAWRTYHLIGDVLRSGELAVGSTAQSAFLRKLQERLQAEQPPARPLQQAPAAARPRAVEAANEGSFRWKLVAGLASVAAVGAMAWSLVGGPGARPGPELAKAPAGTVLTADDRGVMIRNPHLDELMAAHRQLGGASVLSTGFVRNATFEGSGR